MTLWNDSKKKKKTIIYLISGILVMAGVGGVAYLVWPKNKPTESKEPTNSKQEIQQLQTQLNSVKSQLHNLSDNTKKTQLENKLANVESQLKNISSSDQLALKKLEQEIEEVKQEIKKNDFPNPQPNPNPQPDNNDKGWLSYDSTKIDDNTYKYHITLDGSKIDFNFFITKLLKDEKKVLFWTFQGALKDANSKFPAYFWKCPPVSHKTLDKAFEFVVIGSDSLNNITQNYSSFQKHFGKSQDNQAVSFFSPSGNLLVSPVPKGTADYKNISQFTKNAPDDQQQALWKEVADSLMKELEKDTNAPRWLNTEGSGVPYLHVRIDKKNGFYSNYPEYAK